LAALVDVVFERMRYMMEAMDGTMEFVIRKASPDDAGEDR
jgi:hypothetical protein